MTLSHTVSDKSATLLALCTVIWQLHIKRLSVCVGWLVKSNFIMSGASHYLSLQLRRSTVMRILGENRSTELYWSYSHFAVPLLHFNGPLSSEHSVNFSLFFKNVHFLCFNLHPIDWMSSSSSFRSRCLSVWTLKIWFREELWMVVHCG